MIWLVTISAAVLHGPGLMRDIATGFGGTFLAWWGAVALLRVHWCLRCGERLVLTRGAFCPDCAKQVAQQIQKEVDSAQRKVDSEVDDG